MNILIGFGGVAIQLYQVIQNRIKKRGEKNEKGSKARTKRTKSNVQKKGDVRKQDSGRLLMQQNNFYFDSGRAIGFNTGISNSSNSAKPRVIKKIRKEISKRILPSHTPNSINGLKTKQIHSQNNGMNQNSFRSANSSRITESHRRIEQINFIKHN